MLPSPWVFMSHLPYIAPMLKKAVPTNAVSDLNTKNIATRGDTATSVEHTEKRQEQTKNENLLP